MNNINWNKVKIKHVLGIAKDLPGYPDQHDLMFHIIKESSNKKDPSFTDVQLAAQLSQEKEKIRSLLLILSEDSYLKITKVTDEKMIVKITKNPYL
jgi:transcription initiation factor IIE alpha subunit